MSNPIRALIPFLVLLVGIALFSVAGGCETDFTKVKMNRTMLKEYNDSIGEFNDFSRGFTALGKKMDRAAKKEEDTGADFRTEVREEARDLRAQMSSLAETEFTWPEFDRVKEDMQPLFEKAEDYLSRVETWAGEENTRVDESFREELAELYRSIIEDSGQVVNAYDRLYMEFVSKSEE